MKANTNSFEVLSSRLCEMLESEGYSETTMRDMKFVLHAMSSYMESNEFEDYTPEIGEMFVIHCADDLRICSSRVYRAKNITEKFNRMIQGLDGSYALLPDKSMKFILPENLTRTLADYLLYCANIGNRQTTIHAKNLVCGKFLRNLSLLGCVEIQVMTGELVQSAFLAMKAARYWERISPFLRYLYESEILERDYSTLIKSRKRSMPMPTVYSPEEIICVENAFDLSTPNGIRNHAITLVMSRYGIRACDVAALTFNDIDFENNRISFTQQKTDEPWECVLFPEVKAALQNYLKNIRPNFKECPNIFMKLSPPYAPIDSFAINTMIFEHFSRTEIENAGRKRGSRALRSSIASNMINEGASTEIVRKVLGHGTKHALKHYARIDTESMRICPLPVPEPSGIFANVLAGKEVPTHV